MLKDFKMSLIQIEKDIQILKYHIELLTKLFPYIIKEKSEIRKSTANEINKIFNELDSVIAKKNIMIKKIQNKEKVNSL